MAITKRKVLEEQGAFQKGTSCVDQLFIVRLLGEKNTERRRGCWWFLLDF